MTVDAYNDDGDSTIGSDSPDLLGVHSVSAGGSTDIRRRGDTVVR